MNKILNHIVLPSGLHALHIEQENTTSIRIEILTEKEYQHFTWWEKILIKFNLLTLNN